MSSASTTLMPQGTPPATLQSSQLAPSLSPPTADPRLSLAQDYTITRNAIIAFHEQCKAYLGQQNPPQNVDQLLKFDKFQDQITAVSGNLTIIFLKIYGKTTDLISVVQIPNDTLDIKTMPTKLDNLISRLEKFKQDHLQSKPKEVQELFHKSTILILNELKNEIPWQK